MHVRLERPLELCRQLTIRRRWLQSVHNELGLGEEALRGCRRLGWELRERAVDDVRHQLRQAGAYGVEDRRHGAIHLSRCPADVLGYYPLK